MTFIWWLALIGLLLLARANEDATTTDEDDEDKTDDDRCMNDIGIIHGGQHEIVKPNSLMRFYLPHCAHNPSLLDTALPSLIGNGWRVTVDDTHVYMEERSESRSIHSGKKPALGVGLYGILVETLYYCEIQSDDIIVFPYTHHHYIWQTVVQSPIRGALRSLWSTVTPSWQSVCPGTLKLLVVDTRHI